MDAKTYHYRYNLIYRDVQGAYNVYEPHLRFGSLIGARNEIDRRLGGPPKKYPKGKHPRKKKT